MTDDSARIHRAASDPTFPAKREAAVQMICAGITAITTPLDYIQTGTNWARRTGAGRSVINLQRSRYGWDCAIILRFVTAAGSLPDGADWQDGEDIGIGRFYLPTEGQSTEPGVLTYLDLHDNRVDFDLAMQILKERALPWLDAHHASLPAGR